MGPLAAVAGKAIIDMGMSLIERFFPDPKQQAEAKLELLRMQQSGDLKELDAAMQVIVAEAKSDSWLAANWRPLTMLVFVTIIANNYLLYPYLSLFWPEAPLLELPDFMWELLKIGMGGYVVGRSAEKFARAWKQKE